MAIHPRRWFRFRLRTLLAFIALVAIPLAWIANERLKSAYEKQVANDLQEEGSAFIDLEGPFDLTPTDQNAPPQSWWRDTARKVLGERVVQIRMSEGVDDISILAGFDRLRSL
ncbi:MAG TPA: hypothetical protein VGJ26_05605, partial [Pirellulales bacterium]